MNYCFIKCKVISNPEFKFIWKSKNISVCNILVELNNGSIIEVRGYNDIADYIYGFVKLGEIIFIEGILKNKYIETRNIIIIQYRLLQS